MKTIIASISIALLLMGCATTWQDAAGKSLVTVAQTVDAAMKGWETYSVSSGIADNDPQEQKVRLLYAQYQNAFSGALRAYNAAVLTKDQSAWIQASSALSASEGNLLAIINQFQPK